MSVLRKILGGVSLTAAMFVFQACYGTPYDYYELEYNFRIVDAKGTPIPNINVSSQLQSNGDYQYDWHFLGQSDSAGIAHLWMEDCGGMDVKFRFSDKDSVYAVKDTVFHDYQVDTVDIVLSRMN